MPKRSKILNKSIGNTAANRSPHRPFQTLSHKRLAILEKSPDEETSAERNAGNELVEKCLVGRPDDIESIVRSNYEFSHCGVEKELRNKRRDKQYERDQSRGQIEDVRPPPLLVEHHATNRIPDAKMQK